MSLRGLSLTEIERHLDAGNIQAEIGIFTGPSTRWWTARRNGKTRTWKRDPTRFEIPVKADFKSCGTITPSTLNHFRVKETAE